MKNSDAVAVAPSNLSIFVYNVSRLHAIVSKKVDVRSDTSSSFVLVQRSRIDSLDNAGSTKSSKDLGENLKGDGRLLSQKEKEGKESTYVSGHFSSGKFAECSQCNGDTGIEMSSTIGLC